MTTFADLRKRCRESRQSYLKDLAKRAQDSLKTGTYQDDDTMWRPERDVAGNAQAIVRFMPAPPGENDPWARYYDHAFKGPGGWYIEKSRTTLGDVDPVSEYNSILWNQDEAGQEQARRQKRRLNFVANVFVIEDFNAPQNEGRVLRWRFGKTIFDKINEAMNPEYDSIEAIDPFNLWHGHNFLVHVWTRKPFPQYDKCRFAPTASALNESEEWLEETWKRCHPLKPLATDDFKSYDELKRQLHRVLGKSPDTLAMEAEQDRFDRPDLDDALPPIDNDKSGVPVIMNEIEDTFPSKAIGPLEEDTIDPPISKPANEIDEDDVDLAFFKSLRDN